MSEVVIEDVVLRGDDLNIVWSRWSSINRANNLRLVPILLGFFGFVAVSGSRMNAGLVDIVASFAPLLLGWYAFIWLTNAVLMGAYKKAYAATPVGRDPCTFAFDADGMRQTMPRGEVSFRWSAFVDVVEDKRGFRFWMTPFTAVFLPSRFVDPDKAARLRQLVVDARQRGDIKGL